MRALKVTLALALACGVWMAGAHAGSTLPAGSATYPGGTAAVRVGDSLSLAGQPMELSVFRTLDAPARVVRFYADAFRARGLVPVVAERAHVAAFDPDTRRQRFVSAVQQPGGGTLVLIGATVAGAALRFFGGPDAASFPVPPEQRGFVASRSEDAGARAESGWFVSPLPVSRVVEFYRRTLGEQGYGERRDTAGAGLVVFARPDATVSVAVQKLDETRGTAVFVNRTDGDPR